MLWEFPFLPRQLSAVDGFAIGIPAFLLALLPNQQRYQPGFLRRALAFCIPAGIVTAGAVITLSLLIRAQDSWSSAEAQTATSMLLSITGLWVLGSLTRPFSSAKLAILLAMLVIAIGMFLLPATTGFFGFAYLQPDQLVLTLIVGAVASALLVATNLLARRVTS
jgi:cation-transporting ATPase E